LKFLLAWAETGEGNFDEQFVSPVLVRIAPLTGPEASSGKTRAQLDDDFRAELKIALRVIASGKATVLFSPAGIGDDPDERPFVRIPVDPVQITIGPQGARYRGSDRALRWYAVLTIVNAEYWRIAMCKRPECGVLFVRTGRSEYHHPLCSQMVR